MGGLTNILLFVTIVWIIVMILRFNMYRCPKCKKQTLDYDYHGYKHDRPICHACGWDSDVEWNQHREDYLDD